MTIADTPDQDTPPPVPGLGRRVTLTRLALIWESLWQRLWQPACATGLFLAFSLFEIWRYVPAPVHWTALLSLILFWAFALIRWRHYFRWPDRRLILARIERDNGLLHQPLRALEDRQEAGAGIEEARNLWQAHLLRLRHNLPRLKFVLPHPGTIRLDRHGLRQMVGIILVAGSIAAGSQWWPRIEAGFKPSGPDPAVTPSRLDAWITPPAYTGAAPVMLAGAAFGKTGLDSAPDAVAQVGGGAHINVPAGSELSLRLFGGGEAEILLTPDKGKKHRLALSRIDDSNSHTTLKLEKSQRVQLNQFGAARREWRINVIPDQPPLIRLHEDISVTRQVSLRFRYEARDDYGVTAAGVEITLVTPKNMPVEKPLKVDFPAPQNSPNNVQTAYADLSAHQWAGSTVRMRLVALDAAGQSGYSSPVELKLPQRIFTTPLARAIIEQRRNVAAIPRKDQETIKALDALAMFPQKFTPELKVYLPMRVARHRIAHIHGQRDARQQVVDLLWQLALRIQDGEISISGNQLRDLQNELMQALQNGASDEEIARLTQALREAMERYVQAMAEQAMEDDGGRQLEGVQPDTDMIDKSDLDALLDKIEKLSKSGARDAAQRMLSELRNILENMRPGQAGRQQNARQNMYGNALKDLSGMMQQQQKLRDETYTNRGQGKDGEGGLAGEQDKLRGALGDLKGRLEQMGPDDAPNALGRAEQAMRDAAKALRNGGAGEALEQQSEALNQLRAGAGALAKILREEDAKARAENGEGGETGTPRNEKDPLGRPVASDSGASTAVPEAFDIERALQIRRELELRASQRRRPVEELNYIDRLLKLF